MKIKIIEPVILEEEEIHQEYEYLKRIVKADTKIDFDIIEHGFKSIESEVHIAFNNPEIILNAIKAENDGYDGIFVNCFADPGVQAIRELINIPVFGGFIPAVLTAISLSEKICVIASDENGVNLLSRRLITYELNDKVGVVKNVGLGVLELNNKDVLIKRLIDICIEVIENSHINVFVLGCTGMSYIAKELKLNLANKGYNATIVEPLATGVKYLEHLIELGFTNSLPYKINIDALNWR